MADRHPTVTSLLYARAAGVPLVTLTTPDQPAIVQAFREGFTGDALFPLIGWDCARGLFPINAPGAECIARLAPPPKPGSFAPQAGTNLTDALVNIVPKVDAMSVVVICNAHRTLWESVEGIQATMNLRDSFKETARTLVMLAPSATMPVEIAGDVLTIDDPLPDKATVAETIEREAKNATDAGLPCDVLTPDVLQQATAALVGLRRFAVEQAAALSIVRDKGVRPTSLWERKGTALKAVRGLTLESFTDTFDSIGGLGQMKQFARELMAGEDKPDIFVRVEEIEKSGAGGNAGGDLSGTNSDQQSQVLTAMNDYQWDGVLVVGGAGTGKSAIGSTWGATFGCRTLSLDLGAAKGSLVGQSEERIREMLRTLYAIGGKNVFFIASCNELDNVPMPLRRRFKCGVWYFDLPNTDERPSIWAVHLRKNRLPLDIERPIDDGWTGAEIATACNLARKLRITPKAAAQYIVPMSQADPKSIDRLRAAAAGKWLSASYPGAYRLPAIQDAPPTVGGRYGSTKGL